MGDGRTREKGKRRTQKVEARRTFSPINRTVEIFLALAMKRATVIFSLNSRRDASEEKKKAARR